MGKRIGLLGGTFDPVHIGHLRSALEVADALALDELRMMPNARPPHRDTPQVSPQQRLEMVRLAVDGIAPLVVDDRELKRDKPSYTVDTLELMRAELAADDQLFLLLGWDAFCGLPSWHRWEELLQHCHILVLQRPALSAPGRTTPLSARSPSVRPRASSMIDLPAPVSPTMAPLGMANDRLSISTRSP